MLPRASNSWIAASMWAIAERHPALRRTAAHVATVVGVTSNGSATPAAWQMSVHKRKRADLAARVPWASAASCSDCCAVASSVGELAMDNADCREPRVYGMMTGASERRVASWPWVAGAVRGCNMHVNVVGGVVCRGLSGGEV